MISRQPDAKNTTIISTFKNPVVSPFGPNNSFTNPIGPTSCNAQTIQQAKKMSAMANVRFRSAFAPRKSGWSTSKPLGVWCPQPIVPTPGMRPSQFADKMKMKIVARNQNVRLTNCGPMISLQKVVQTFDQPFQEVLSPAGNTLHVPRRDSGKDDQGDRDNPTDDHGIGDEAAPMFDFDGGLRQAVLRLRGKQVPLATAASTTTNVGAQIPSISTPSCAILRRVPGP